jgi:hypothetical protein
MATMAIMEFVQRYQALQVQRVNDDALIKVQFTAPGCGKSFLIILGSLDLLRAGGKYAHE